MILPTKRISAERSLLGVGAVILTQIREPRTVSQVWHEYRRTVAKNEAPSVGFDWFVLALDLLFALKLIELSDDMIARATRDL